MSSTPEITPDTKDWTWVLERPCPDCGFDPSAQGLADLPGLLHDTAMTWSEVLRRPDVGERPSSGVWSPLEYACHVRDVHVLFAERVRLMLEEDRPVFANWDQDVTAVESDYPSQDPAVVVGDLIDAAGAVAGLYAGVDERGAARRGTRSNGDEFTVASLGSYHLHDVVHHLHDVGAWPDEVLRTVGAYDEDASAYALASPPMPDSVRADVAALADRLGAGARVLEVGSGSGRDALLLEAAGLVVRRTDVTPGFVTLLREQGHTCDLLDPLVDDLTSPVGPYDAVWANASLLHVRRADLPTVLARLAAVTRAGGELRASFKEGDGEGWSTHGSVTRPRHFTYWRPGPLQVVVEAAGWTDVVVRSGLAGSRDESWIELSATRGTVSP